MPPSDSNIAVLLISVGVLSIAAEFCLPGKVILGVLGAVSLTIGLASLLNSPSPMNWPLALATILPTTAVTAFLLRIAFRARRNKRAH